MTVINDGCLQIVFCKIQFNLLSDLSSCVDMKALICKILLKLIFLSEEFCYDGDCQTRTDVNKLTLSFTDDKRKQIITLYNTWYLIYYTSNDS